MVIAIAVKNFSRPILAGLGLLSAMAITQTANAQTNYGSGDMVARYNTGQEISDSVGTVLSRREREHYSALFAAIDAQQWNRVQNMLRERTDSVLYQVALAEFYTHANSPRVSADQISRWFDRGVQLPQSEQLVRLGTRRGLERIPALPTAQNFTRQPAASKRIRPRSVNDGTMPAQTRVQILDAISNDNPALAHSLLGQVESGLSREALAEWRQRVSWSYYIENNDKAALELAETVSGGSGAWVAEGDWVAGLAAWRLGYCLLAAENFSSAASRSSNVELTSAAHYWAHRSLIRCREPGAAQQQLQQAARYEETLYGMLAVDQLGMEFQGAPLAQNFTRDDWRRIGNRSNVQIAVALTEINRPVLADEVLRHEARIGSPNNYAAIGRLARELGLPSTQLFMAHNAPRGVSSPSALRYPVARWQPATGWRIDPSLAFAHALQESNFRAGAVSPANARGLMQILPGTARDHNRRLNLGANYSDLNDPEVNLAYGQQHLEMLRDSHATGGLLPKIMAAYNAGLSPVSRWNSEINDQGDALLWMESIPYWETRGYVAIVMRNYWMYERAAGVPSPSRRALAQGRWPRFPQASRRHSARLQR